MLAEDNAVMEFLSNPKAKIASDIFDQVKEVLGDAVKASSWMFSANVWLYGSSPIEALREGREDEVRAAVTRMMEKKCSMKS